MAGVVPALLVLKLDAQVVFLQLEARGCARLCDAGAVASIESNVSNDLHIHVVMDNASSHKTKLIRDWFAKRANWHPHFTPTSSSWINQVERSFALLTSSRSGGAPTGPPRNSKRPSWSMSTLAKGTEALPMDQDGR
jgi:DDE superfamily endonuclease